MSDDNSNNNKPPRLVPPSGSLASSMMLPKSSLLSRVGDFLPQLQAANKSGTLCCYFVVVDEDIV